MRCCQFNHKDGREKAIIFFANPDLVRKLEIITDQ